MLVSQAGEPVAEVDIAPPAKLAGAFPSAFRSVWIWPLGWVLCQELLIRLGTGGVGEMVNPGRAISRDQASWTLVSLFYWSLLCFGIVGLMSFTVGLFFGYWEIQFLEVTGPSCVSHQVKTLLPVFPWGINPSPSLHAGSRAAWKGGWPSSSLPGGEGGSAGECSF